MPSAIIHRCVNKRVEDRMKKYETSKDKYLYDLGSIAPDSWRNTNQFTNSPLPKKLKRMHSHFSNEETYIEDYKKFYNKYKEYLNHPFIYGYLIHLMTDNIWRVEMYLKQNTNIIDLDNKYEEKNPINQDVEVLTKQIAEYFQINELEEIEEQDIKEIPVIEELPFDGINTTVVYTNYQLTNDIHAHPVKYDFNQIINGIEIVAKFIVEELKNMEKEYDARTKIAD